MTDSSRSKPTAACHGVRVELRSGNRLIENLLLPELAWIERRMQSEKMLPIAVAYA
jgi:hypothetical protein